MLFLLVLIPVFWIMFWIYSYICAILCGISKITYLFIFLKLAYVKEMSTPNKSVVGKFGLDNLGQKNSGSCGPDRLGLWAKRVYRIGSGG